ncbi:MAG: BACON domain-containing protein, partial [Bacteroidales bacterium]|nr:BACON domain-containing protein [Bacteroidales bacterium]
MGYKSILIRILPLLPVVFAAGCGHEEEQPKPVQTSVIIGKGSLDFSSQAGQQEVSFLATVDWTATSTQPWVKVSPSSGTGSSSYQSVIISADENIGEQRAATVTISAGGIDGTISVSQKKGAEAEITINEFIAKKADKTTWYKLSGEIVAIANASYGNFYIATQSSYLYVYGLTASKADSNDQSFPKLGLKVGDKVTMMTLRSEYNGVVEAGGTIPAYYVSHESGEYKMGRKEAAASAKWLELPATDPGDGQDLLIHFFPDGKARSYSAYWDYDALVSTWVAYPLCKDLMGSGGRTMGSDNTSSAFPLDPLLPQEKQPLLNAGYQD